MLDLNKSLLKKQQELLKDKAEYIQGDVLELLPKLKADLVIANEVIADLPKDGAERLIKIIKDLGANAFITEFSCDYEVPEEYNHLYKEPEILRSKASGTPEAKPLSEHIKPKIIELEGHCEYAMSFQKLKRYAESEGFKVKEGSLIELVKLRNDDWIKRVVTDPQNFMEAMMKTFINKLKMFRYLVLENVH